MALSNQTTGDLITSTIWNALIAVANILYGGTAGQVLTATGGGSIAGWASPFGAWASVANSGTPSISASFNVASLTDNGVGDTTVTFTSSIATANYAALATTTGGFLTNAAIVSKATGSVRVITGDVTTAPSDLPFSLLCVGG